MDNFNRTKLMVMLAESLTIDEIIDRLNEKTQAYVSRRNYLNPEAKEEAQATIGFYGVLLSIKGISKTHDTDEIIRQIDGIRDTEKLISEYDQLLKKRLFYAVKYENGTKACRELPLTKPTEHLRIMAEAIAEGNVVAVSRTVETQSEAEAAKILFKEL